MTKTESTAEPQYQWVLSKVTVKNPPSEETASNAIHHALINVDSSYVTHHESWTISPEEALKILGADADTMLVVTNKPKLVVKPIRPDWLVKPEDQALVNMALLEIARTHHWDLDCEYRSVLDSYEVTLHGISLVMYDPIGQDYNTHVFSTMDFIRKMMEKTYEVDF